MKVIISSSNNGNSKLVKFFAKMPLTGFKSITIVLTFCLVFVYNSSLLGQVVNTENETWFDLNQSSFRAFRSKDYDRAVELSLRAKIQAEKEFGKEHKNYIQSIDNLAYLYFTLEMYDKAEPLYKEENEINEKVFGKDHLEYATSLNKLANLYKTIGQLELAEPLYIKALEIRKEKLGDSQLYAVSINNLAFLYDAMERHEEAEKYYIQALEMKYKLLGLYNSSTETTIRNFAEFYYKLERYEDAKPLYISLLDIIKNNYSEDHLYYADALYVLAELYLKLHL